jgi:hypothetical protein
MPRETTAIPRVGKPYPKWRRPYRGWDGRTCWDGERTHEKLAVPQGTVPLPPGWCPSLEGGRPSRVGESLPAPFHRVPEAEDVPSASHDAALRRRSLAPAGASVRFSCQRTWEPSPEADLRSGLRAQCTLSRDSDAKVGLTN